MTEVIFVAAVTVAMTVLRHSTHHIINEGCESHGGHGDGTSASLDPSVSTRSSKKYSLLPHYSLTKLLEIKVLLGMGGKYKYVLPQCMNSTFA